MLVQDSHANVSRELMLDQVKHEVFAYRYISPNLPLLSSCFSSIPNSRLASPSGIPLRQLAVGEGEGEGWDLRSGDLAEKGKRPASQQSDEALRDRQELETWNREASREHLVSWTGSITPRDKDLDQGWKDKDQLENWGQHSGERNPGVSEGLSAHNLDSGREQGVTDSAAPGSTERECAGGLDNAARSASAAARARTLGAQDYSGRRNTSGYNSSMSSGAPCGACKFLRRKCVRGCIFAPYFSAEQGAAKFAAVHKVFGASNVAKLLLHIPAPRRGDAVLTISYEAQARLSDPVYGCVATIFALQQQVASLQAELAMVQTQLADRNTHLQQQHHQQQRMTMAFGASASQAAEYIQHQHLADHSQLSPTSGLSMGMPGGSSAGPYSRVKEEGSYLHGMQAHHYDIGMPTTSMEPASMSTEQSLLESLQRSRSGGMGDQPDEGELQALASLFRRK
nr:uncharacterized protein LOC112279864 [Physcomitrium patens]|eukprot:XP_024370367.1 uncharacterized protein LOC112279864 [Physcomitrella patens]